MLRYVQYKLDKRKYEDIRTSTNTFYYFGNNGRGYCLTLRPPEPILDSDLKQGWEVVCDDGAETGIALDMRSFSFHANGTSNSYCLIGQVLPSSWLEHPWGLRFTVLPGGTGPGTDVGLADTIMCMYLVGGSLPTEGLCKADLANNPVIRVDNLYKGGSGTDPKAELRVFYGENGLASIDELRPLSALVDEGVKWKHRFGVQLAGEVAALFEHGGLEYAPTFAVGSLPTQTSDEFVDKPRIYLGARQIGQTTNVTYLVESVVVRPPYEWDVLIRWDEDGIPVEEIATVIHAAGEEGGRPEVAVTYDTHGTQWRPGGR